MEVSPNFYSDFSSLTQLLIQHSTRLGNLWSFQIAVFLGVIGWIFAHPKTAGALRNRLVLSAGIALFAFYSIGTTVKIHDRKFHAWEVLVDYTYEAAPVLIESIVDKNGEFRCKIVKDDLGPTERYLMALKPGSLPGKIVFVSLGYCVVLTVIWLSPSGRLQINRG